jgi:Predicted membrane protein
MFDNMCNRIWNLIGKLAYILLNMVFKLIKQDLTDKIYENFMQFVKFGIVGLSNTIISYIVYVVSLLIFRQMAILINSGYLVAQVVAFVLSVLWSFYWNNKIVFNLQEGEERSVFRALIRTFISYSFTGLFLNSILLFFWVKVVYISEFIAPIINLLVSVPLNFVINKFWAFKKNRI